MSEGSVEFHQLISKWPPEECELVMFSDEIGVHVYMESYGCYTIEIGTDSDKRIYETQPINYFGDGYVMIRMRWANNDFGMSIERKIIKIKSKDVTEYKAIEITVNDSMLNKNSISIIDEHAKKSCEEWIIYRTDNCLEERLRESQGRRRKTDDEQIKELENSVQALEDLYLQYVNNHKEYFISHIAASLRALLYFHEKKTNYNPLLLRIAAKNKYALPVVISNPIESEEDDALIHFIGCEVRNYILLESDLVIDIQEWLSKKFLTVRDSKQFDYSPYEIILDYSNTLGNAHYDVTKPEIIDIMEKFGSGKDAITQMILTITDLTIGLTHQVLDQARK